MKKDKVVLEHKIGERVYMFMCEPSSPLGETFDALNMMIAYVNDMISRSVKQSNELNKLEEKACDECK